MRVDARTLGWVGAAGSAACVIAAWLAGEPAWWRAWLGAATLVSAGPIGAAALVMMIRLIPGAWAEELSPFAEAVARLVPLTALLFVPVLFGVSALYPWTGEPRLWLSQPFFIARTLAWFAAMTFFAWRGGRSAPAACIGLMVFALGGTVIAVDWLLSLDPDFASSGFGLYVLCIQVMTGLVCACAAALIVPPAPRRPGLLGGLMLTLLLLWAYFAFMHYFITWSDNLPPGVRWYQRRTEGAWSLVAWAIAISRLAPAVLLLFGPVRRKPRALLAVAATVSAGTVLEIAWLTLPGEPQPGGGPILLYALAALSAGTLTGALHARRLRP